MANANLRFSGGSNPRARGGCRRGVLIGLLVLFLCIIASLVVYLVFLRRPSYTLPSVVILEPAYGAELVAGQPVLVLSNAISAARIAKQELWVDGLLVYIATTRDPQGQKEFVATLLWKPKAGNHMLITRATDGRGSVGTSDVVRVNVAESAALPSQNIIQIAQEGDTFNSIAEENAITPEQLSEANPDLQDPPPPGEWVNVPPGEDVEQSNDDQPGGNVNDPGAAPIPPGEDVGPADPNPGFQGFGAGNIVPLAPDLNVAVENCHANLTWHDNSDNEAGFYIYRLNHGERDFSRIANLAANNAHAALRYQDQNLIGDIQYFVAAYSNAGESASRIVQVNIAGQDCLQNLDARMLLEVEAESLTAPGNEEVFCYASLKGHRPFERVPIEPTEYLRWMSPRVPHRPEFLGEWNIDEHYGGDNKRIVTAPEGEQPFRVEVECWGAHMTDEGGEAYSLGRFDQSHPSTEWDGRALTGNGDSFTLVYHIRPWSGPGGNPNALLDPDIPAPFDLRLARDFNDCVAHMPGDLGSRITCALISYPDMAPLVWEWNGVPEQIDGFRVYVNRTAVGGTYVPLQDVEKNLRVGVDPTQLLCGETWRYAVSAFDLNAESPRSEFIALSGGECNDLALVEVELLTITPTYIDDGVRCTTPIVCLPGTTDHVAENYGRAWFWTFPGEHLADQNQITSQKGASLIGPVRMRQGETYQWADLPLCHNSGDDTTCLDPMGHNNQLVFLVREGEGIGGKVVVVDEDLGMFPSGDDLWCSAWFELPAVSLDEWAQFDQAVWEDGWDTDYGHCTVTIQVRGLGRAGGSRVIAPGGGAPALSGKSADLQVLNIQRNRLGNAQITLYNAGPDTLIDDAVTLSFQVARVESGAGGSPETIFEHEERALVTIPAFGQTTIDTGQVLLEGFENRVYVTLSAVNFTDPDLRNNAGCKSFDVPDDTHVTVRECAR